MQTIGERLEEGRKKNGISIREAAEATKIRGDYLQKFESNHFDIGLSEIYVRGFLRTYGSFLKIPTDRLLSDYATLGRGANRPRPPARDGYGRTGIAPAADGGDANTSPAAEIASEPSATRPTPRRRSSPPALPSGPDPAVVFRYVKIGGGVLLALIVLWLVKPLFFPSQPSTPATGTPTTITGRAPLFGLVALKPVQVTVRKKTETGAEGQVLFSELVTPGETKMVARPGAVYIEAVSPENLLIEINGKRFPMGLPPGERRGELPAP